MVILSALFKPSIKLKLLLTETTMEIDKKEKKIHEYYNFVLEKSLTQRSLACFRKMNIM